MFALIRYWVEGPSFYFPLKLLHFSFLPCGLRISALCFRLQLPSSAFLEHNKSGCCLLSTMWKAQCGCVLSHFSHVRLFVNLMAYNPPGSSVHGILQARILEWVAMASFRGSSQPRDQTCISYVSCFAGRSFYPLSHLGNPERHYTEPLARTASLGPHSSPKEFDLHFTNQDTKLATCTR